jgi:hypothetical protein
MENNNILDPHTSIVDDDNLPNSIFQMTSDISDLVDNISSGGVDAVRYPIDSSMYTDVNYHTREYPIVCIHLCVYQRQVDLQKHPFIQYLLRLENGEMGFYNKPFFNSVEGNLYIEATAMLKVLMAHYGKFLVDDDMYDYTGFHKDGNDVYMFFDVTKNWIAYHLLNMSDPFWTIMIHEIVDNHTVCGHPISANTIDFFEKHPELSSLVDRDNKPYALPRTGYSLEDSTHLDQVLLFGKHATPLPALGGEYFQFMTSYADCVHGKTKDELKDKIVVRYYLMCDDPINPPDDMVYEEDGIGHEGTSYHASTPDGRYILAVKNYNAQITITAYNAISDTIADEPIHESTSPVEADEPL